MTEMVTIALGKVHTTDKESGEFQERFRHSKKEPNRNHITERYAITGLRNQERRWNEILKALH